MSAGIYMYNGQLAYSLNLEKKLKRRKGAIIIEECVGNPTEEELQKLLLLRKMVNTANFLQKIGQCSLRIFFQVHCPAFTSLMVKR